MATTKRKQVKEAKAPYRARRRRAAIKPVADQVPLRWADIENTSDGKTVNGLSDRIERILNANIRSICS